MSTIPTFGYHAIEGARKFELKPGEALPEGWYDSPAKCPPPPEPVAEPADVGSAEATALQVQVADLAALNERQAAELATVREELESMRANASRLADTAHELNAELYQARIDLAELAKLKEDLELAQLEIEELKKPKVGEAADPSTDAPTG